MPDLIEADTPDVAGGDNSHRVAADELRRFVSRIEAHEAEIKEMREEIKDEYRHAKSRGYDVKVLRKLIALRRRDSAEVAEEEAVLEMYREALVGWKDSPLGKYAAEH